MIYHITPSFPPRLGGLEKVVEVLSKTQDQLGISNIVITSDQGSSAGRSTDKIPVIRLGSFYIANTTIIPRLLYELLKIKKTDIAHVHVAQAFTPEVVWLASKIKGFSYVAHIHLDVAPTGKAGFLLKLYKPLVLKRVLHRALYTITFTNDQRKNMCRLYGLKDSQVATIPNGVESFFYRDKPRKLHALPRLLFVGRLSLQKNIPQLLRSLSGISERFSLTLVGDGELGDELKQLSKRLRLRNVRFVGRADGERLRKYYEEADIFVLTSEREGMPLVLLEAMAMGLPAIATNVTGNRDVVVNNRNGLLVDYDDDSDMQTALIKLAANPRLYSKLSRNAHKMALSYSWLRIAKQINELYGRKSQ